MNNLLYFVSLLIYSREKVDFNQTFEKQIIQFKRTWAGYHYGKIL